MDERSRLVRAWDVFLDVGVSLWPAWLFLFVFALIGVDAVVRALR